MGGAGGTTTVSAAAEVLAGSALEESIARGFSGGTLAAGAAMIASLPDVGCPQVVQKLVPDASLAPHDLQTVFDKDVDGAAGSGAGSIANGGAAVAAIGAGSACAGAVSSITAGCAIR
jgi:hypothetical protein